MNEFDFTQTMTAEQIKLARAAGKIARHHAGAGPIYDSLTVGESLLIGRAAAMAASYSNTPHGKAYTAAFHAWKKQFGFIADKTGAPVPQGWLDDCIYCAQHRTISDKIIASLSPSQRANMGVSGLTKRVRREIAEMSGETRPQRMTPMQQMKEQLETLAVKGWRHELAEAALRRHGLAINADGELVVIDKERFAAFASRARTTDEPHMQEEAVASPIRFNQSDNVDDSR